MIDKYGVYCYNVTNIGKLNFVYNIGKTLNSRPYPPINKLTSLIEATANNIFSHFDEIMVLEQDLWFWGEGYNSWEPGL
jgi:hypothetical protein